MERSELVRVGLILMIIASLICLTSCSVMRETSKNVWTVEFKTPIKVNRINKCK